MKRSVLVVCIIFCFGVMQNIAQNNQEKDGKKGLIMKELIGSGEYIIDVSTAYPQRGKSVPLTSSYSLEIRNDSVISYLPYYGRAHSIPYGGGNGLIFSAPIDEYDVVFDRKKDKAQIKIKVRTNEDVFRFTLDVYLNGSSRINVNMQNRETISFSGEINNF